MSKGEIKTTRLHQKLRALRKKATLTLRELGQKADLSISYLSDIERGRTTPSLETCQKLASVYLMDLGALFKNIVI